MKQSTTVLLFGIIYALIALLTKNDAIIISLIYAVFSGLTAILYVILDHNEMEQAKRYL